MSRWGGEETKGQGIIGCAFAGVLLLIVAWGTYKIWPALQKRAVFEKQVNAILRGARTKKMVVIENSVMEAAKNAGVPLERADLDIKMWKKDKYTPIVEARIPIHMMVDLGWGETSVPLPPIKVYITLISF